MPETNWFEKIFLIILISVNILEFTGLHLGELSFIKDIVSFSAVGYVLYKASLTQLFFGKKNRRLDLLMVITYFLLITSKFTEVCFEAALSSNYFTDFFLIVVDRIVLFDTLGIIIGNLGILAISIFCSASSISE